MGLADDDFVRLGVVRHVDKDGGILLMKLADMLASEVFSLRLPARWWRNCTLSQ